MFRLLAFALSTLLIAAASAAQDNSRTHLITRDSQTLELNISTLYSQDSAKEIEQWMEHISEALFNVYGKWPRDYWRTVVNPASGASSDPIPWAQVNRDTIDQVSFYTLADPTAAQLIENWTGYHELAHLLVPYRGWGDKWFSEGLASYYQCILQARSGVISEQQMWQKLYDGFMRAQANNQFNGSALHSVSSSLRQNKAYMRVYWSGAWYFLSADLRLRQQSGGKLSLDNALALLNNCCANTPLSVPNMVARLDEINEIVLFAPLYKQVRNTTAMPEFDPLLASLGVDVVNGEVVLQDAGPGAKLRRTFLQ
ncbi:MAG: hypothetical protein ABJ084_01310 [Halioglobus sp.]